MLRIPSPALPLAGALLLLTACGGPAPITPPPATPMAPAASAASVAPPPPQPPAPITAGAMPGDAQIYAELSGIRSLLASARGVVGAAPLAELRTSIARELGVDDAAGERLIDAIASLHLGGRRTGDDVKMAVSVVFSDAQPMRDLLASGKLTDHGSLGPYGRRLGAPHGGKDALVWFEGARLLASGDMPMLESIAAVVEGRTPGITDAQRGATAASSPALAFVTSSLLDQLVQGRVSFAAPLSVAYDRWEGGYRGAFRTAIAASGVGAQNLPIPPPRPLALAKLLPVETAGYLALSTGIPGGNRGAGLLLAAIAGLTGRSGDRALSGIDGTLAAVGVRLADILGALGDEGVLATVVRPGVKSQEELEHGCAVVLVQEVADVKLAERLLKVARDKLSSLPKKAKVHPEGTGFSVDVLDEPLPFLRVRLTGGRLVFAVGQRDLVDRTFAAVEKGKGRLTDDAAHTRALSGMPPSSLLRLWVDLSRTLEVAGASLPPGPSGAERPTSALAFTAAPEGDRIRLDLDEVNGISVFAALGIYGVRRYLGAAKSAEATNTLGALTRAATAAYEREQLGPGNTVVHALCRSAQPVPSAVPRGVKYHSSATAGTDWDTGDATSGWRCLKFVLPSPQYFRYSYSAGGPYKGPARGGPDPGPNGFEVAAEGDLDGNGVTSLYTRVGTVDPKAGVVKLSTSVFVSREGE